MPPSPIPAPLPPWAKGLLQLLPFISGYLAELLEHIGEMHDATSPDQNSWRHVQCLYHAGSSTDPADTWIMGFDLANITGGQLDSTWTDADYTTVQTHMDAMTNALLAVQHEASIQTEIRYYRRAFNPYSDGKPFAPSGPPEKVYAFNRVGTATGVQAPQVACSITEKTAYPHHWGRCYLPGFSANGIAPTLHISSSTVDSVAQAVHGAYAALMAAEFFPVVPVTQVNKVPTRGLLTVSEVQVDDVADVIRRRRIKQTGYRKVLPV